MKGKYGGSETLFYQRRNVGEVREERKEIVMGRIVIVRRRSSRKIIDNCSEKIRETTISGTGKKIDQEAHWAAKPDSDSSFEEIELKRRRKREKEASSVALERQERSVDFDDGLQAEKQIRFMCRSGPFERNPLNQLGLFMKRDYSDIEEDDDEEEVILCGDYATNKSLFHHDGGGGNIRTSSSTPPLSPKQAARVSMLKSRFMDVISKSQQQLGLLDHHGIQDLKKPKLMNKDGVGCFKRSSTQYCKSNATINAPIRGATVV
ncbi:hypothetical protein FEM48_Zijuj10G0082000 [Ziziphus jujuba var. spinosa]|uniref:Uncharacterized protein n=1 Tax=Ziziphus jujuba var. spinosa TaxID=714518 RepID=A0A978UM92_ZIZJJ|nr:hypothetical protein FEM48_Zijuj10G0082000 [Ziziphus jujuba var. spinosa]